MAKGEVSTRDVVLAVAAYSEGRIEGRTLLQKTVYFLNELGKLGISFDAAYYGPYSQAVAKAASSLVALGFLRESGTLYATSGESVFPMCKYTYTLTEEGKEVFQSLDSADEAFFRRLQDSLSLMAKAGNVDYESLSLAAKMHHILKSRDPEAMTKQEITSVARQFRWEVSAESVEKAADFLTNLKLVTGRTRQQD